MDIELLQNPDGVSSKINRNTIKRKKRRARKKAKEKNGPQIMDKTDVNPEASNKIADCKLVNNDLEKNLLVTDLTMPPLAEKMVEVQSMDQTVTAKESKIMDEVKSMDGTNMATASKIMDEVQSVDQTQLDTGSTENLVERNSNTKRKRKRKKIKKKANIKEENQSMDQTNGIINLHLSDGNHGIENDGKPTENECTAQESEFSVRKESSLSDSIHDKGNPINLCKAEESVLSSDVVDVSSDRVSSELVEERGEHLLRSMDVEGKIFPGDSKHSHHADQMAGGNAKLKKLTNELNNEIIVSQEKCSTQVTTHISSSHMKEAECLAKDLAEHPRVAPVATIRRKLLVLDVNGLLANIVMPPPKHCRGDTHIYGRAIFKRPFCDDFLKFSFQNFDVAIWSSRSRGVIIRVVDYLLGDLKEKLLFCWDMDHSTKTGFKTLENYHKPLVCKELRRIWENDDPNLPWKKGDYDESNTLLLDDSPYKALLNPLHTAIFPNSYHFEDKNDNSLGPGGDLRVYLEGLLTSENVQKYVEQHPFGQSAINETNLSWGFYSGVLETMLNRVEANTPSSLPRCYRH